MNHSAGFSDALRRGGQRAGFTLIELLIVVAIIAILAAIALPNFLDAQVRSKVSRSYADMRTIATALETYRVDTNRYPLVEAITINFGERMAHLTTPISYITSAPLDPFYVYKPNETPESFMGKAPQYSYAPGNLYLGGTTTWMTSQHMNTIYSLGGRGPNSRITTGMYCLAHPNSLRVGRHLTASYDPTNGTVSGGDLIRLSPGTMGIAP